MCVLESKGNKNHVCMEFVYLLVHCMENVNKHCLVLVKYIKRQRNLSKKSKKRHQIVPIKLKKKKKTKKRHKREKKTKILSKKSKKYCG